ncbi:hypothetical protein EVG20_g4076 [Dentipellis fragilis]|uniref:Uncharacterized protein n=1 Tax=Dentipellis fragilis TaxID=205917 RepID=A0A4Y9YZ61_9AGAM|nr:hypothetical protein EVG20_g4076 [Dentipellis fragilis]
MQTDLLALHLGLALFDDFGDLPARIATTPLPTALGPEPRSASVQFQRTAERILTRPPALPELGRPWFQSNNFELGSVPEIFRWRDTVQGLRRSISYVIPPAAEAGAHPAPTPSGTQTSMTMTMNSCESRRHVTVPPVVAEQRDFPGEGAVTSPTRHSEPPAKADALVLRQRRLLARLHRPPMSASAGFLEKHLNHMVLCYVWTVWALPAAGPEPIPSQLFPCEKCSPL